VAAADGVRLEARVGAWRGVPDNLAAEVTPVLVTVTNEGDQPLRLRYNDFTLVSPSGKAFAALPPFNIEGAVGQYVDPLEYPLLGFGVAPYLSPYYPWLVPFHGPVAFDSLYYRRYYPAFVRIDLPTGDMIRKALPEGVVEPQERVAGFLYFEHVGGEVAQVDLKAELINAHTSEQFATVRIPFLVG
jgi:hypothetical protein